MYITKQKNNSPYIFTKKINDNYKLIPFKENNDIGETKYLPPSSKEWKNSVYTFNKNSVKNLPVYDLSINSLIKNYFNLYFYHKFLANKYVSRKSKRQSFNKVYVSKAEFKHTNSKVIITIHVYNREKIMLLKKINKLKLSLFKSLLNLLAINTNIHENSNILSLVVLNEIKLKKKKYTNKLYKQLSVIRKYKLKLDLNKFKFEEKFLFRLSKLISKYYNKQVEFNIVNLKSIVHNSDIFTEILTLKLKKPIHPMIYLRILLGKVKLPTVEGKLIKGKRIKIKNLELLDNKYPILNISSIINKNFSDKDSLSKLIFNAYNTSSDISNNNLNKSSYSKLRDIILNSIKYKNISGVRLTVKGRLTKRYRADRAVYKLRWKGSLRDVDSAYKGLPLVNYRGYLGSNIERSMFISKRRIGSFAVKGWFGAK